MKKQPNEIYTLVDEEYLSKFSYNHRKFMEEYYYKLYCKFCQLYERTPLSLEDFFKNMRRRRIQLYQLCCPYCGTIYVIPHDKKLHKSAGLNYCTHCGKGSTTDNIFTQISRFIRINSINRLGLKVAKETHSDTEEWVLAYDCYQMEIIELASIIEVVFRDYFEALMFISNFNRNSHTNNYIVKTIKKENANDFMNVEKSNNIYKKAFNINIREKLDKDIWNDLIDIVSLRNMMVHNNGIVDEKFKKSATFDRYSDRVTGNLIRIEDSDIAKLLKSVITAVTDISDVFLDKYFLERNSTVANFYFNNTDINFKDLDELQLSEK